MLRYRTGIDRRTGELLTGWDDVSQSIEVILATMLEERIMRTEFGSEVWRTIGKNLVPPTVLQFYRHAVGAIHRWEPEYRVRRIQLLRVDALGTLGVGSKGLYYPEGRFGNYRASVVADGTFPLAVAEGA